MIVSLHPEAETELVEATSYYSREANSALGAAFLGEFNRSIDLLRARPGLGARWRGQLRRLPLRRFPYSIVYQASEARLWVVAVAHQSRRPGYWRARRPSPREV